MARIVNLSGRALVSSPRNSRYIAGGQLAVFRGQDTRLRFVLRAQETGDRADARKKHPLFRSVREQNVYAHPKKSRRLCIRFPETLEAFCQAS